jgi:hypothetical protein
LKADREGKMRKILGVAALTGTMIAAAACIVPATAAHETRCDGFLAPGTYQRVVVPDGAVCLSEGPITIRSGLWIGSGSTFVLGSEESGWSTGRIGGGVHAVDAASVQIHFATINGGIDIHGGSGPFGSPFDVTWNAIEDNVIHGAVTIEGYDGFWMGFIRNTVSGSVKMRNNTLVDPDGNEYVTNTIHGSLSCWGNSPAPQIGDSEGSPNDVTGRKAGQCVDV